MAHLFSLPHRSAVDGTASYGAQSVHAFKGHEGAPPPSHPPRLLISVASWLRWAPGQEGVPHAGPGDIRRAS